MWEPVAEVALGAPAVVGQGGLPVELAVSGRADRGRAAWTTAGVSGAGVSETGFVVTARQDKEVVGLAEGRVMGGDCDLDRLVVGPVQRGQGVGSHLVAAVESLAAERGCGRCRALAALGSRREGFLLGRGWVRTGVLADWQAGEDYARLERRLG